MWHAARVIIICYELRRCCHRPRPCPGYCFKPSTRVRFAYLQKIYLQPHVYSEIITLTVTVSNILRIMYWTTADSPGSVSRGGLDGSDVSVIVTGLSYPAGIAIDFHNSRLYWTVGGEDRVQLSDMHGTDVRTVIQLPRDSGTYGIALYGNRIYVTNWSSKSVQSFTTAGQDLQELLTDTNNLYHLAIISARPDWPTNRQNHCENHGCSKVCVLTPTAYKCVT